MAGSTIDHSLYATNVRLPGSIGTTVRVGNLNTKGHIQCERGHGGKALDRLSENKVVELDDERKAAMVSNLLVVLCGNRDAQPIVNSGSLY